jgi:hypothetical protein
MNMLYVHSFILYWMKLSIFVLEYFFLSFFTTDRNTTFFIHSFFCLLILKDLYFYDVYIEGERESLPQHTHPILLFE